MQHPDEGTIHAWLDGQLPPDEAAALEAHVSACPGCAAKVAEERGISAGATRILTALDDVPGDVLPAVAKRGRFSPGFARAAAAILLVATGGVIAVRVSGDRTEIPTVAKTAVARGTDVASTVTPAAPLASSPSAPVQNSSPAVEVAVRATPPVAASRASSPARKAASANAQLDLVSSAPAISATPAQQDKSTALVTLHGTVPSAAVAPATALAAVTSPALTVIKSDTVDGVRRIFLRTASGKVATLVEATSPLPPVTAGSDAAAYRATGVVGARASASSTAALQRSVADNVRTITWMDAPSGKFYSLAGPFTQRELEELRAQIQSDSTLRK